VQRDLLCFSLGRELALLHACDWSSLCKVTFLVFFSSPFALVWCLISRVHLLDMESIDDFHAYSTLATKELAFGPLETSAFYGVARCGGWAWYAYGSGECEEVFSISFFGCHKIQKIISFAYSEFEDRSIDQMRRVQASLQRSISKVLADRGGLNYYRNTAVTRTSLVSALFVLIATINFNYFLNMNWNPLYPSLYLVLR
jgi:hypothetical protein